MLPIRNEASFYFLKIFSNVLIEVKVLIAQLYLTLQPHRMWPARLLCPWNSPGKNTEVGCHSLLQGIFLTQGSGLGLPHCKQILHHLSLQGSMCVYMCVRNILLNHMCEIVSINKEITFQNIC